MFTIKSDRPEEWESCNIYPLADWHIGDRHSTQQEIDDQIQRVLDDPHGLAILNGDLMNTALKSSVSDIYGETMKPMEQIETLVGLLKPIKDRIIGATTGNHEARIYREDGVDIMRLVCRELGIESCYDPDGVLIFLRFGAVRSHKRNGTAKRLFTIYATHGSGGGRKEGAKALRLADMACIVDADIYLRSHVHTPLVMKNSFYRTNLGDCSVKLVEKTFVNTSAMLDYGGYGQRLEFKPASTKNPVIHLEAKNHSVTVSL